MRTLVLLFAAAASLSAAQLTLADAPEREFVIGISPFLDRSVKDEVFRSVVRLVVEDLPLRSSISIYDSFEPKSIAHISVPQSRAFTSAKARANQFAPAIRALKAFLATEWTKPKQGRLDFNSAIRLPQFYDFLAENAATSGRSVCLLLIGSPLYQDAKEPGFSIVDGFFPSDGHLQATRDKSIFGTKDAVHFNCPVTVHWVYPRDPWLSDLHREEITRFWTLYLRNRGAELATFSGDFATALPRFERPELAAAPDKGWKVDPAQTKLEMLRVGRTVDRSDWLTSEHVPDNPAGPPAIMIGPLKIGIRWRENIDLDLYATPKPGAERLFFQHPRSPEGYYYKDHRSSPGREYEFIEFESPVDIRKVEASVNFYKGSCPGGPRGEVRIEFDGRIYSAPFAITADEGNLGREGRSQSEYWTRIPVQTILKLESFASARAESSSE